MLCSIADILKSVHSILEEFIRERPEKIIYRLQHLCLDRGYDYDDVIEGVLERD